MIPPARVTFRVCRIFSLSGPGVPRRFATKRQRDSLRFVSRPSALPHARRPEHAGTRPLFDAVADVGPDRTQPIGRDHAALRLAGRTGGKDDARRLSAPARFVRGRRGAPHLLFGGAAHGGGGGPKGVYDESRLVENVSTFEGELSSDFTVLGARRPRNSRRAPSYYSGRISTITTRHGCFAPSR